MNHWQYLNSCHRIDCAVGRTIQMASDCPTGIILTAAFSLTGSRGEYLRVVGTIVMVE